LSAPDDVDRYLALVGELFAGTEPPPETKVKQLMAVRRLWSGEDSMVVAEGSPYQPRRLLIWRQAISETGLWHWLGKRRVPDTDRFERAKAGIAQILLGQLAEEHFETVSIRLLGEAGFTVDDQRLERTDTDYRLLSGDGRPICRLNIKFHGTLFKQAAEYVGLEPSDCFALATYKIHGALVRQEDERLPYAFLIISVPDFPREAIERHVSDDWAWLASHAGRLVEERIAARLATESWCEAIRARIRESEFRVLSARRADRLLRENLFRRVHALRLRAFNQLFRGAEINMHLSLSQEMIGYAQFLEVLKDRGALELAVRLERGEI
jgi:hypothetical protein